MSMPISSQIFSYIFPYTFWLQIFMSQTLRGDAITEIIIPFLAFLVYILGGILAFSSFKRKLSDSKYWGRD
jgi:ABC-2 type transport system permease protein